MAKSSRYFPRTSTANAGRRGQCRRNSFQTLLIVCGVAAIMITPLWYAEESNLQPSAYGSLRGGPSTIAQDPNNFGVEGSEVSDVGAKKKSISGLNVGVEDGVRSDARSSAHSMPSSDLRVRDNEMGQRGEFISPVSSDLQGQTGGVGVDQYRSDNAVVKENTSRMRGTSSDTEQESNHGNDHGDPDAGDLANGKDVVDVGLPEEVGGEDNRPDLEPSTVAVDEWPLVEHKKNERGSQEPTEVSANLGEEEVSDLGLEGAVILEKAKEQGKDKARSRTGEEETTNGNEGQSVNNLPAAGAAVMKDQGHESIEEGNEKDSVKRARPKEGAPAVTIVAATPGGEGVQGQGGNTASASTLAVYGASLVEKRSQDKKIVNGDQRAAEAEIEGKEQVEEDAALTRRKLNALVAASVARADEQKCNIAFVKTHKTASTTLAAVLYRYGVRHGKTVAKFDVEGTAVTLERSAQQTTERGRRVDIFHYHYVWDGFFRSTWQYARSRFQEFMADPEDIKYVTALRNPVEHWLSYYYFYYQPENKLEVDEYLSRNGPKQRPLNNPLAAEFGIYDQEGLDDFIEHHLPAFTLIIFADDVDEGLVLLGMILGWDPIDLTYASMLTSGYRTMRWDARPLKQAPRLFDLDGETIRALEDRTRLDAGLYEAAKRHYAKVKEMHSEGLEQAVKDFQDVQAEVLKYLQGPDIEASPARSWYLPESDYYFYNTDPKLWWKPDYSPALPFR